MQVFYALPETQTGAIQIEGGEGREYVGRERRDLLNWVTTGNQCLQAREGVAQFVKLLPLCDAVIVEIQLL